MTRKMLKRTSKPKLQYNCVPLVFFKVMAFILFSVERYLFERIWIECFVL